MPIDTNLNIPRSGAPISIASPPTGLPGEAAPITLKLLRADWPVPASFRRLLPRPRPTPAASPPPTSCARLDPAPATSPARSPPRMFHKPGRPPARRCPLHAPVAMAPTPVATATVQLPLARRPLGHLPISYIAPGPSPDLPAPIVFGSIDITCRASAADSFTAPPSTNHPPITTTIIVTIVRLPAYPLPSPAASLLCHLQRPCQVSTPASLVSCGLGRGISIAVPLRTSRAVTRILSSQCGHTRVPHAAGR